jgi:F-box domain
MLPIPVDVLQHILDHLDQASLAKICQVNKTCCSCSRDVLYRDIQIDEDLEVCETLAQSTHLAERVRSFDLYAFEERTIRNESLRKSLQNMTNLRNLRFFCSIDFSILDGCNFRLALFRAGYFQSGPALCRFLHSQPSLTDVALGPSFINDVSFTSTCLPNLTRIAAKFSLLPQLIPNRPVSEVFSNRSEDGDDSVDLSFFTLSTAPIRKLTINYLRLYSTPVPLLASIFPSLTYLCLTHPSFRESKETVRCINNLFNPNRMISMYVCHRFSLTLPI